MRNQIKKIYIEDLTPTNELYEIELEGKPYYQIEHALEMKAVTFDHDPSIVEEIKSYIKEHGRSLSLKNKKDKLGFRFTKSSDGTPLLTFETFLYHCYSGLPIDEVRTAKVTHIGERYLPDGSLDCRSGSLVWLKGCQMRTPSRTFEPVLIGGREFYKLELSACDKVVYLNSDPVLLDLLTDTSLFKAFHLVRGSVQVQLCDRPKKYFYLSQIVVAVRDGLLTRESFTDIGEILPRMTENGQLEVDHLDTDTFNNTYHNLSLMPTNINSMKKGYTAASFPHYTLVWAYDYQNNVYLVQNVSVDGGTTRKVCTSPADLLNLIQTLVGQNSMTKNLKYSHRWTSEGVETTPLPSQDFTDAKEQHKASGGTGRIPKVELDTRLSIERSSTLLDIFRDHSGRFNRWTDTNACSKVKDIETLLANFGARLLS